MGHLLVKPLPQLSFAVQYVLSRALSDMWAPRISHTRFWAIKDYTDGGHPWWIRVSFFVLMLPFDSPCKFSSTEELSASQVNLCCILVGSDS